jgi:hypothetical protein
VAGSVAVSGFSASNRATTRKSLSKRIMDAIVRSRMTTAERLVRHYEALFDNARIYGDYRRVRLGSADRLPFNT